MVPPRKNSVTDPSVHFHLQTPCSPAADICTPPLPSNQLSCSHPNQLRQSKPFVACTIPLVIQGVFPNTGSTPGDPKLLVVSSRGFAQHSLQRVGG